MELKELRDRVIEDGIASAKQTETLPHKLQGCLNGFAICRRLETIEDFAGELQLRSMEEEVLRDEVRDKKRTSEDYWTFRCATAQIEWTFDVLKVAYRGTGRFESFSARAMAKYAQIVQSQET